MPCRTVWWLKVEATDAARDQVVREAFLGRRHGQTRALLMHVPRDASELVLTVITLACGELDPVVTLAVQSRTMAALRLIAGGWRQAFACLPGDPTGLAGRLRVALGQAPARAGEAPPYDMWIRLYDQWGQAERRALAAAPDAAIEVAVTGAGDDAGTLASARRQWVLPVRVSRLTGLESFARLPGAWLLVVQAGDVLADHAVACFANAAARSPEAAGFYADLDMLRDGVRSNPLFKPATDPWLARSAMLQQGTCVFAPFTDPHTDASCFERVPFILTHAACLHDAALPPPRPEPAQWPRVSIIIPTSAQAPHVLRCLRGLLANTDYPDFDVLLAVANTDDTDARQVRALRAAARLARVRVLDLGLAAFNYAGVNNAAARVAQGALLLLLNDDVMPAAPDWLRRMVRLMEGNAGPRADIVGARLLYGNGQVQHGGVIMGLANLCEHAFRLTARGDAGPHGIAFMDRAISAVTGACLLTRASLWQALGGMDEGFAIALNDVDFCLRAAQAGAAVVMAPGAVLYHFEGQSLGRHYSGERANLETLEVRRLRERWQSVIADDPHYNPQASLEPGREFQPAFPPRKTKLCWIHGDDAAQA